MQTSLPGLVTFALAMSASAAQAQEPSNYLRLGVGATSADAARPRVDFGGGFQLDGRLSDGAGYQLGVAAGRAWRWARVEVEYQYGSISQKTPTLGASTSADKGDANFHTGMINAYATAPLSDAVMVFAGAGAGVARFKMPGLRPSSSCTCFSSASRTAMAYQGRAGAEWRLGQADALFAQYNHLRLPKVTGGSNPRTDYAARTVQAVSIGYLRRF